MPDSDKMLARFAAMIGVMTVLHYFLQWAWLSMLRMLPDIQMNADSGPRWFAALVFGLVYGSAIAAILEFISFIRHRSSRKRLGKSADVKPTASDPPAPTAAPG